MYPEAEDEIDLLEYFRLLWAYKWFVATIVILTGIAAVFYSLRLPNIYRSDAVIVARQQSKSAVPSALASLGGLGVIAGNMFDLGGGSLQKFQMVLNSRIFSVTLYQKHKNTIMPVLYEKIWDKAKGAWNVDGDAPPTTQDITKAISQILHIQSNKKSGTLTISVDHQHPAFAKKMVEYCLQELSDSLRAETLNDSVEKQKFLRSQLNTISDALLKEKLYAFLAKEIERETFAHAQAPYAFQIIDPPIVPDINKRIKPKRSQICILSVTVAFFMAVFLAFFIEYIKKAKIADSTAS